ncbi:MAG: O-antigen ligase family protein [Cetobacterium sp.]
MINKIIIALFFSLFLIFPNSFSTLKYILLFLIIIIGLKYKTENKFKIYGLIGWYFFSSFSLGLGLIYGYKIDLSLIMMYFGTPFGAFFISNIFQDRKKFIFLNRQLEKIFYLVILLDCLILLDGLKLFSIITPFLKDIGYYTFGKLTESKIEFRIPNQTSLMFLIPYFIFTTKKQEKIIRKIALLISFVIVILSGRRALQIITLISLVLFFIREIKEIKEIIAIIIIIIIIYLFLEEIGNMLDIKNIFLSIKHTIENVFNKNAGSGMIRSVQRKDLLESWYKFPIFGKGINSSSDNIIRSLKTPWSYEDVYIAFLMQGGIVGSLLFWGIVINGIKNLMTKLKQEKGEIRFYYKGILMGSIFFLLAAGTNPMIYYIWFWSIFFISFNKK